MLLVLQFIIGKLLINNLSTMKKIAVFLLSLCLLSTLIFSPYGSNSFELPKLVFIAVLLSVLVIFLVVFFLFKRDGEIGLRYNKFVTVLFAAWLLSLVLSTVFSVAPELSFWGSYSRLQGLYSQLIYLSFFVIALHFLVKEEDKERFLKWLLFFGGVVGVHAICQHFGLLVLSEGAMAEFLGRSFSTFGHPNFLGQFLLFPIWVSVYFILENRAWKKVFYTILLIILLCALATTENRASILGLFAGAAIFVLFSLNIKRYLKYVILSGFVVLFGCFIAFVAPNMRSMETRLYLWSGALQLVPDHPIIGSGLETFGLVFQKATSPKFFELEQVYSTADRPHNEVIDVIVSQGLLGLIVYVLIFAGLFYGVFVRNKDNRKLEVFLALGVFSALISNFFGFSLVVQSFVLYVFVAMILNGIARFKTLNFGKGIIAVFIAGLFFSLSILLIGFSINSIRADYNFVEGTNRIYAKDISGVDVIIKSINQNVHQADIFFQLGEILLVIGDEAKEPEILELADEAAEKAGEFTGYSFRYHYLKGKLAVALKNFAGAESEFTKAMDIAPINPIILKEMASMYYNEENYPMAIKNFEKFLSLMPDYWKDKNRLDALSFDRKEKYRLFFKHIPDFWDLFDYLSMSYAKVGDKEKSTFYLDFINHPEAKEKVLDELNKQKE